MTSDIQGVPVQPRATDIVAVVLLFVTLCLLLNNARLRVRTPNLRGPKSDNTFFGTFIKLGGSGDPRSFLGGMFKQFGTAFSLPMGFGRSSVVVCDPKGVAHILARDTYYQPAFTRILLGNVFGESNIFSTECDDHRRIRAAMTPAFSNTAIRSYVETFHENYRKMSFTWDAILDSVGPVIEVQKWMNRLALENLGTAGFSHEFNALDLGKETPKLIQIIESFQLPVNGDLLSRISFFLSPLLPWLLKLPSKNTRLVWGLRYAMRDVADDLVEKTKRWLDADSPAEDVADKSIIRTLIEAEGASGGRVAMTLDEVVSQNALFFAGYETTSNTLTWALIELSRNPEVQAKLRHEVNEGLRGQDATLEQLMSELPYLDAITQETLRAHPPLDILIREAQEDDVVPLLKPVLNSSGELVSEIAISAGQWFHLPIGYINMSEDLWGPDAREFNPERWLKEITPGMQAIRGHHHIMSFGVGTRFCLGKRFALASFKVTLANLIRDYTFELPYGEDTKVVLQHVRGLVPRPTIVGEKGTRVPLIVRRVE